MNEKLRKHFLKELADHFQGIYICTRVWSAWSYSTMNIEDFYLLCEDENFIESIFLIFNENEINQDTVVSYIENYEAYFNFDIENNFKSNLFFEDWLEYLDINGLCDFLNIYKLKNNFNNF